MKQTIYERAAQAMEPEDCFLEATCVSCTFHEWQKLMQGHTRADKRKVLKIALKAGVIDRFQFTNENKNNFFNPYNHFKTKTHIIYVHSGIEHFIKII